MFTKLWLSRCWWMGMSCFLAIGGAIAFFSDNAKAQPIPDATLGGERSVVTPNVVINGITSDRIDGGAIRGSNLFHSFSEFNVGEGRGVYFTNPAGIENILSRVTGGSRSEIVGKLGVLGNANLFLINPNGIIFGRNASLDVGGSFVATTANAIKLGNTGLFSASEPVTSNLLSVSPSAFFFNAPSTQSIINRSVAFGFSSNTNQYTIGLQVPDDRSLLLVGGDVSLDRSSLYASGGRVELGGLARSGTIGLSIDGNNLSLSFPQGVQRADVSLTDGASVNVTGRHGGDIAINARNLNISESVLSVNITSEVGAVANQGGDIKLNATGAMTIANSGIYSFVAPEKAGNGGNIDIQAGSLSLTDGTQVIASTFGKGNGGNISLQVKDTVSLVNSSIDSYVEPGAMGNGGNIDIHAGSLSLYGDLSLPNDTPLRAELRADTFGNGNAGNVLVQVKGPILVFGNSGIYSLVEPGGVGEGGDINIQANSLSLDGGDASLTHSAQVGTGIARLDNSDDNNIQVGQGKGGNINIQAASVFLSNNALLSSETFGLGDAGSISLQVQDAVSVSNSFILSGLRSGAVGNGNDIYIKARSLSLTDGGVLSASTGQFTQGKSGNVWIDADDFVNLSGVLPGRGASGGIFTTTEDTAMGQAGNITVNTNALRVSDGAVLSARTNSAFDGGNITVNVKTLEAINGGQIFTTASSSGRAGNITVNAHDSVTLSGRDPTYAERLQLYPGTVDTDGPASGLFARSTNQGNAGNISVTVRRGNLQANDGKIATSATQSGGGDIDITAKSIRLRGDSDITTTSGGGNGGNITLNAKTIVALEDSDILSFAPLGNGGNITFNTRAFLSSPLYRDTAPITDPQALETLEKYPNGRVDVNASGKVSGAIRGVPDITFLQNGLTELPTNLIDTNHLIANSCIARSPQQKGSFIITGAGGLPTQPDDPANAPFPTYTVPTVGASTSLPNSVSGTNSPRLWKKGDPIVEPQGVYRLPDGHLVLSRECSP